MYPPDPRDHRHFHACRMCGNIWDHDPAPEETSPDVFQEMHTCQICRSKRDCDQALGTATEAEELATHGYVTYDGEKFYAQGPEDEFLSAIFGGRF